jgi:hypothetical protein
MPEKKPGLFGIKHSNRDFTQNESWGKNQFNSSFPASLAQFIHNESLENIYLKADNNSKIVHSKISTTDLYGIEPTSDDLFFAFENQFTPYQQFFIGNLPRVDLVTQNKTNNNCIKALEVKLTALPDNSTCDLEEKNYSCEIVVRPDTIVYLAASIALIYKNKREELKNLLNSDFDSIEDWTEINNVTSLIPKMIEKLDNIITANLDKQTPLVMQPIWKTIGKTPILADNCLDIFVWSNFAFIQLFSSVARDEFDVSKSKITRQVRTIIWLFKMLFDFSNDGQINHKKIIDELSYNTKNDKAFAMNGIRTHPFLKCEELLKPRITKENIKKIILGGGQKLLSPERRFDAIIFNSQDLFE